MRRMLPGRHCRIRGAKCAGGATGIVEEINEQHDLCRELLISGQFDVGFQDN